MQQAYRALRVIAESQTIRVVLAPDPSELMLDELRTVCAALASESSVGIKAVVLYFTPGADVLSSGASGPLQARSEDDKDVPVPATSRIEETTAAIHAIPQPVLAVVQGTLSATACALVRSADLILVADDAVLIVPITENEEDSLTGAQAARLEYVTWSAPAHEVRKEMERILDMLRGYSAVALRYTKASVRLATVDTHTNAPKTPVEALQQVNELYLAKVMQTADAHEGLQAFLEKRKPSWKNM